MSMSNLSATDLGQIVLAGLAKELPDDGSEFSTVDSNPVTQTPGIFAAWVVVTNTETGDKSPFVLSISRGKDS